MPKVKYLHADVKRAMYNRVQQGIPNQEVAAEFGVVKSTITKIIKLFAETGSFEARKKSGRPKVTSARDDNILERLSKKNPFATASELNAEMKEFYGVDCCVSTTKSRLRAANLFGRRPARKPYISKKNRKARLSFARDHLNWTDKDWAKVLWSDESKFNLFNPDGFKRVRRPINKRFDPKYQVPTVKHGGGNVMVWGAFSRDGVGPLHRVEGIMDQVMYKNIIGNIMLPHAKDKMRRGWIFQQDNDPKHTAKSVKQFFATKKIRVLDWPSQSPDLNPIEHLWEHIDRQLKHRKPTNQQNLYEMIEEEWKNIPLDVIIHLVDSMPSRCQAVIDSKGFATKY
jgi:transposase